MRDEVRALCGAVDELRESLAACLTGYRTDDWRPVPSRPIVSMPVHPASPNFASRINAVDPNRLPDDVPNEVRSAVAARLRESQGREGMDSLTRDHRPKPNNHHSSEPDSGATIQRSLWNGDDRPSETVEPVATVTENGAEEREESPTDIPSRPYTLADFQSFQQQRHEGTLTAESWKAHFRWLVKSKDPFIEKLLLNSNAGSLKALASRCGVYDARRNTKPQNAEAIFSALLRSYTLGSTFTYQPLSETLEEAATRQVEAVTDETIATERQRRDETAAKHEKSVTNPETLDEFRRFVSHQGEDGLSDAQHLRRDQLYADMSRKTRAERQATTVQRFESESLGGLELSIKAGYHDKRQCPLWIVQLSARVDPATYKQFKTRASQLGGRYSSFKRDEAGFQFFSREAAEKFIALKEADVDRTDVLEGRRVRKLENAAERFSEMADRLEQTANETLASDEAKLKNTVRRAEMAASARAQAREQLATATTLRSLASELADGESTYLDGVRHASQIDTLHSILRHARWRHIRESLQRDHGDLSNYQKNLKQDELEQRPLDASDVRYAEFPKPRVYRRHLKEAVVSLEGARGVKQVSARMRKLLARAPNGQDFVEFTSDGQIQLLEDFLRRAKATGYICYCFDQYLRDYNRLRAANIHDAHELRAALAELLPHLAPAEGDDPVTRAIDELRGKDLPGFFPTPRAIVLRMLDLADIRGDDRVLEPSCGMGDILDAIRQSHPDVELTAIEQNHTLADVLAAKGYSEITTFGDFLEHQGPYDKILMNPPFEGSAEVDHVRKAYDLLSVGGRLVSVMSKGPFFRSDTKSREFREWLEALDHQVEELPDDAFRGVEAFRQTGVRTALMIIDKTQ